MEPGEFRVHLKGPETVKTCRDGLEKQAQRMATTWQTKRGAHGRRAEQKVRGRKCNKMTSK